MTDPLRVVVVGGGASGVLVAARLLDASVVRRVEVTVVEVTGRLGAGVAYGTDDPDHLVNVRASAMSADPSLPRELVEWIGADGGPDTFVARRDYRRYLQHHLARAVDTASDGSLRVRAAGVTSIRIEDDGVRVDLSDGGGLVADAAVIAIGNPPPAAPGPLAELGDHPAWVPDPWAAGALARGRRSDRVLLVGNGLTAVDAAITLARDHQPGAEGRPIRLTAVSRTGLTPRHHLVHQPVRPIDVIDLDRDSADVAALAARIRARAIDGVGTQYDDEDWREVIDAIRPFANALWRRYDRTQRERFMTDLARTWDVHRHRMAPPTAERFLALRRDGRLMVERGSILAVEPTDDDRLRVAVADRRWADTHDVDARDVDARDDAVYDLVVNCTGPGRPWLDDGPSIVGELLRSGLASRDELGLGLRTVPHGCLVASDGRSVPQVLVIGTPRRGSLWETTAIPELRSQALHIADRLITTA